jgi:tRNA(Ile)-lysidine synthase
MSELILNALNNALNTLLSAKRIWVAYSGGVDSHVLLHALSTVQKIYPQLNVNAIYIHHGLLEAADQWAIHCKKICDDLKIPCQIIHVNVKSQTGESLEAAARNARYDAFSTLLAPQDILLTAHQEDDQTETFFLQLMRGAGTKGLSSMQYMMPFAQGTMIRPFLSVSREAILNYAKHHQLKWVEDTSNCDTRFARNFLRHRVIPLLKTRWPTMNKTITRATKHCLEADHLLQMFAEQDLASLTGNDPRTLSITKLQHLPQVRQRNILRLWLHQLGFPLPNTVKLQSVLDHVIKARTDKNPLIQWKDVEIRRYQDDLYAIPLLSPHQVTTTLLWDYEKPLTLPCGLGTLSCQKVTGKGIRITQKPLMIKFRQGGESCYLKNRLGKHSLKKLFQEWKVPPWERHRIPLIFVENQLALITGYAICEKFAASTHETGLVIEYIKKGPS